MTLLITLSLSALNGMSYYPVCTNEYFHWDGSYKAAITFLKEHQVDPITVDDESMQDQFASYVYETIKEKNRLVIKGVDKDGFDIQITLEQTNESMLNSFLEELQEA